MQSSGIRINAYPTIQGPFSYDNAGNQLSGGGISATYNSLEQTSSVTVGGHTTNFRYADVGSSERYSADGTTFLNGLEGLSGSIASSTQTAFTRDPSGNLISLRKGGQSYYYLLDGLGSVVADERRGQRCGHLQLSAVRHNHSERHCIESVHLRQRLRRRQRAHQVRQPLLLAVTRSLDTIGVRRRLLDKRLLYVSDDPINRHDSSGHLDFTCLALCLSYDVDTECGQHCYDAASESGFAQLLSLYWCIACAFPYVYNCAQVCS